jgi:hypothetical protein
MNTIKYKLINFISICVPIAISISIINGLHIALQVPIA